MKKRKCKKCGWEWKPYRSRPEKCSRCKTKKWDIAPKNNNPFIFFNYLKSRNFPKIILALAHLEKANQKRLINLLSINQSQLSKILNSLKGLGCISFHKEKGEIIYYINYKKLLDFVLDFLINKVESSFKNKEAQLNERIQLLLKKQTKTKGTQLQKRLMKMKIIKRPFTNYTDISLTEKQNVLKKIKEKLEWLENFNREEIKEEIISEFKTFLKEKYYLDYPSFELSPEELYHDFLLLSIQNTNDKKFKKLCLFYLEIL